MFDRLPFALRFDRERQRVLGGFTAQIALRTSGRHVLLYAAVAAAYYAVFRLPFRWPPGRRLVSASYAFGFDNRVAFLAVAGLLVLLAAWVAARRGAAGGPHPPPLQFNVGAASRRSAALPLAAVVLLYAALTAAMYAYTARREPMLTWESRHFLHRVLLMDVYGLRPYTSFHAEYGPALTATPLHVHRLLQPFGATHAQAYFASHLLLNAAGLVCLAYLLWQVAMPPRRRVAAFVVLAVAGFGPHMGLNGVLLRYLCPFASLLLGHRVVTRIARDADSPGRWVAAGLAVLALLVANVLLSPEIGLAFALVWLAYATLLVRQRRRVLGVSLAAFAAAALVVYVALPPAYHESLRRFSAGANNLPLLPAPHLLLYLLTLFAAAPPLLAAGLRALVRDDTDDVANAALCGALGCLCVALAPGALGRADPPHVLYYGLGAAALLLMQLANGPRRRLAVYLGTYAAVHVALAPAVLLVQFYGVSPRLALSRGGVAHVVGRLRSAGPAPRDAAARTAVLAALDRYPRLGLPFATFGDPAVEREVLARGRLRPEYHVGTVGIYSEPALRRKLRDVAAHSYLLIPRGYEVRWSRDGCAEQLVRLRRSTLYPAQLRCRAAPLDADDAVNGFVADRYRPVEYVGDWVVLRRRFGATAMGHGPARRVKY